MFVPAPAPTNVLPIVDIEFFPASAPMYVLSPPAMLLFPVFTPINVFHIDPPLVSVFCPDPLPINVLLVPIPNCEIEPLIVIEPDMVWLPLNTLLPVTANEPVAIEETGNPVNPLPSPTNEPEKLPVIDVALTLPLTNTEPVN